MFSSFLNLSIPKFGFGRASGSQPIKIPPVEVHDVEVSSDKRGRRLKHLLKLNHATFSILYNQLRFHNHTPHILGSAYLLGGTADQLNEIYEDAASNEGHEPWTESPSEIALHDYRDFLGKREYQRAFVDFFEDQLVLHGYDWKEIVEHFLFERGAPKSSDTAPPIFNCLTAGLGHPLIHLGYAYELNSREVAMEALGLAATCYDGKLARLLDGDDGENSTSDPHPQPHHPSTHSHSHTRSLSLSHNHSHSAQSTNPNPSPNPPTTYPTNDLFEVFACVRDDSRLDAAFDHLGGDNLSHLLSDPTLTSVLLEHWRAWQITDPTADFAQSQALAAALLISGNSNLSPSVGGHDYGYDFFLVHLLTTSHAVRVLVSFLDPQHHLPLVREWLLITLAIYIAQLRPPVKREYVTEYDLEGRDWGFVVHEALEGTYRLDAHFVKACRALKEAARVWGDDKGENYYLKAAVRFASEFDGWGGFGAEDETEVREVRDSKAKDKAKAY
ncbi:hypothetical protein A1O1_04062 [Capronia coronata CBS 617.96]|uniref:Apoptosis regulator Bcl-2 family BH4 domain-containing protein n=1 Tax=Capronia coronata CBS 617.96 TaxID=1182541 RepID=W9YMR3_9EURO|nr:uncharacterized protein A1O1_04062 [Capronia coronata CBS 617.96]EXJ90955.1 hypothetical protein A1O1_04062 [Capronia coronata CBS 617.96]